MAIGAGIATVGLGIYSVAQAENDADAQEENISNFERKLRDNPAENIKLSTEGTDRLFDASASSHASTIDALQLAGARVIQGAMPSIVEKDILTNNLISQNLGEQDARRSYAIAGEQSKINSDQHALETKALMGMGKELGNARQRKQDGINNIIGGALSASRGFGDFEFAPKQDTINEDEFETPELTETIDFGPDPFETSKKSF